MIRAKSHVIDTFKNVKPLKTPAGADASPVSYDGSVISGFRILQQFGKIVDLAQNNQSDFTTYVKSLTVQQKFDFMNNAAAYLSFADMGRALSGDVAGQALEKYLAIMFNMPVGGGTAGAADNLGKITGGGVAYLSAKLMTDDSIYSVTQARGGAEGIDNLIGDSGRQLIYINVQKKSGEQNYELLNVFVTRVYKQNNLYMVELLDSNGGLVGVSEVATFDATKGKNAEGRVAVMIKDRNLSPTFAIPSPVIDKDKLNSTSKLLDYATNVTGDQLIKDLKSVVARTQQLSDSMSGYRAAKAGEDADKTQKEVTSISDEYQGIFNEIQRIFTIASTDGGGAVDTKSSEQGSVFAKDKKQSFISESKQLVDVIREMKMTEKELKKR